MVNALGLDFDRRVLSVDGPADTFGADEDWEVRSTGPTRQGLAANVRQAWADLEPDAWVLDVEEDFVLNDCPVEAMAEVLRENTHLASMVLLRQPVNPDEANGVLHGPHIAGKFTQHPGWIEHRRLWSLNPSLAHASHLLAVEGAVEADLTAQALMKGWSFGYWGDAGDPPRCEHIGTSGGMNSPGWLS